MDSYHGFNIHWTAVPTMAIFRQYREHQSIYVGSAENSRSDSIEKRALFGQIESCNNWIPAVDVSCKFIFDVVILLCLLLFEDLW